MVSPVSAPRFARPFRAFPHGPPAHPADVGLDPRVIEAVCRTFHDQQRAGLFPGGQLAIRRYGRLVVHDACGWARGARAGDGEPLVAATPCTPFPVFSAGKPLIAIAIALLEERGCIDVHAPIADIIPEFGVRGKESITTLDVLTHRGGILMPEFAGRPEEWRDWNKVVDAICAVRPSMERGVLAYHPLEYGWILSEIVRRITSRPLPEFLRSEFLEPAGLTSLRFGIGPDELSDIAHAYWLGRSECYIGSVNIARLFDRVFRLPEVLTAFVPGAGLVADAAALTAFYDLLLAGGRAENGRRLIGECTIRRYTERHAFGWCRSNRAPMAVGRGFLLGTRGPSLYGWFDGRSCFGHAGAYCTVAFGDRRTGLSVAFVTNGNRGPSDLVRRFVGLAEKVRRAVIDHRPR